MEPGDDAAHLHRRDFDSYYYGNDHDEDTVFSSSNGPKRMILVPTIRVVNMECRGWKVGIFHATILGEFAAAAASTDDAACRDLQRWKGTSVARVLQRGEENLPHPFFQQWGFKQQQPQQ